MDANYYLVVNAIQGALKDEAGYVTMELASGELQKAPVRAAAHMIAKGQARPACWGC